MNGKAQKRQRVQQIDGWIFAGLIWRKDQEGRELRPGVSVDKQLKSSGRKQSNEGAEAP